MKLQGRRGKGVVGEETIWPMVKKKNIPTPESLGNKIAPLRNDEFSIF